TRSSIPASPRPSRVSTAWVSTSTRPPRRCARPTSSWPPPSTRAEHLLHRTTPTRCPSALGGGRAPRRFPGRAATIGTAIGTTIGTAIGAGGVRFGTIHGGGESARADTAPGARDPYTHRWTCVARGTPH